MIRVRYSSIDRYRESRTFKTLAGARKYAVRWIGEHPEIGSYYAVSGDGVGKIEVSGDASLKDIFPPDPDSYEAMQAEFEAVMEEEAAKERAYALADAEAYAAEMRKYEPRRSPGCKCSDHQLAHVGCDCGAEDLPF